MDNKYPRGKFNAEDEGQTQIAITVQDKTVIVYFEKSMKWLGMDKEQAKHLGQILISRADEINDA